MKDLNLERALWASHGLLTYATGKEGGDELYDDTATVLTDLLADLMHLCAWQGVDFRECIIRAETHYDAEHGGGPLPPRRLSAACLALARFEGVDIEPVFEDREEGICVPVPDAPHTADFWTVYGRLRDGGAEALIDCADEHSAHVAAAILSRLLGLINKHGTIDP